MAELGVDGDGFLELDEFDDGHDLNRAETALVDAAFRSALEVGLRQGWEGTVELAGAPGASGSEIVYDLQPPDPAARLRGRVRVRPLVAAAAAAMVVVGAVGLASGWFTRADQPQTVFSESPPVVAPAPTEPPGGSVTEPSSRPDDSRLARIVTVGASPRRPILAGGALWIPNRGASSVTRLDPVSGDRAEIEVGDRPDVPIEAAGAVWVPARESATVARVDLVTNQVASIEVGDDPDTPVLAAGHLWVAARQSQQIAVIDPSTLEVIQEILLDGRPLTPVVLGDWLLFVTRDDNALHRIDLTGFDPTEAPAKVSISVGADPDRPLITPSGLLWIPARDAGAVSVVDAATMEVLISIPVGETPDTPMFAAGRVWVPNAGEDTVTVIDAATFDVVEVLEVGRTPRTGVADGTGLWIPVEGRGGIVHVDSVNAIIVETIETGPAPDTPSAIGQSLWVPHAEGSTVVEIRLS
jgi:YVTN family beta-propeller protein